MTFHSRGALSPTSPLFRGRKAELARLVELCQQDVSAYVIIYGGRQTGKTSLLLQLEHQLHGSVRVCRVDFQGLPGADAPRMYRFLAQRIAAILPLNPNANDVTDPPSLVQFLTQELSKADVSRLIVLMDELGTLSDTTRDELGNVLRSMFHARLITPALAKLQIVLTGGIELHHLVVAEVSALHNICEEIHLGDLDEADAVDLVADGLEPLHIDRAEGEQIGRAIYAWVQGHPYLTQRLGQLLAEAHQSGTSIDDSYMDEAIDTLQRHDVLLRHLRGRLFEYHLQEAARQLLTAPPRFSRLYDEMARLELLGLAKGMDGQWAVRNSLIEMTLRDWLGIEPMKPLQALPTPKPEPKRPSTLQIQPEDQFTESIPVEPTLSRSAKPTPPQVYDALISYTRFDDQHPPQYLTTFREHLSREVQAYTGKPFRIFQDIEDIAWGEQFDERIDHTLDTITFFIPILTPSFFESEFCRYELEKFLAREQELGRSDLVLPVYYIRVPGLDRAASRANDLLMQTLAARQYIDWRDLRFETFDAPEVRRTLARIAKQIAETLN